MAYPKLAEGNAPFVPIANNVIPAADYVELLNQLKAMMGPREYGVLSDGRNHTANTLFNAWERNNNPAYWLNDTEDDAVLILPVQLYVGQKITSVHCTVSGAVGSLGGSCKFIHGDHAAVTLVDMDGVANCWDTGGVGTTQDYDDTGDITVVAGHSYFFALASGTNASTHDCRVQHAHVIAQFGN